MRQTALAAVVLALVLCVSAVADVPETISFQGVIRDNTGTPVPDDTYQIVFSIYPGPIGAPALWTETQMLYVEGGIVNASIGSVTSLTALDFLDPYWLGIAIEGETELVPRTAFETVPYAGHAAFADHTLYGNWEGDGDDVYRDVGNVGVGLPPVDARLDVVAGDGIAGDFSNGSIPSPTIRAANAGGTGATFYSCSDPGTVPVTPAAVYGRGACGARGGHFYSSSGDGLYAETTGTTTALVAQAHGTGLAAQFLGDSGIQVQYRADVGSFRMYGGSSPGYVLTSDADGVGTWQAAAGSDGDWTVTGGNDMYANPTGLRRDRHDDTGGKARRRGEYLLPRRSMWVIPDPRRASANINRTSTPIAGNDALQIAIPFGSPAGCQLIEAERGGVPVFQVNGDGLIVGSNGASISSNVEVSDGQLLVDYDLGTVAEFTTVNSAAIRVLHAEAVDAGGTMDGSAVYGKYVQSIDYGIGGNFYGGYKGVDARSNAVGGAYYHYGVYGAASGSSTNNYGVYGTASGGTPYAGYFAGNAHVSGTLTAGAKAFKIDHPLDPANKYLLHSCVESDEMANVYSGNVTLDAGGKALVELPDWFEALNGDFRYQLTAIGAPGPNLYVSDKIEDNRFGIAGGEPGMEVSWQVTGVRHDPYSVEHRIAVEQDKPAHEVGKYMNPELYGMPKTASVDYDEGRGVEVGGGLAERRQSSMSSIRLTGSRCYAL